MRRPLSEAPGQLITPAQLDDGLSVLAIALWFLWDCAIFPERLGPVFLCSYDDEWNRFLIPPEFDPASLRGHFGELVAGEERAAKRQAG
jgi:hypothetical protein